MFFTAKQFSWLMAALMVLFIGPVLAHGMSDAEKQLIIDGGNLRYIWIGATHMLSGYDHLAFVFGIIFFLSRFRDIVKYITAFTLGHSITLIIATFAAIQVNYFLVDAVIALSVCYIAFHNFDGFNKWLKINPPNMMLMIFSLGLIHGMGLSTRLQDLPLDHDNLLLNILSFNLGIEIGQISALALMLVLIRLLSKTQFFTSFKIIANTFLILLGGFLFLMQMHGYEHSTAVDEYAQRNEVSQTNIANQEWQDNIEITVPANGEIEYKIHVQKDDDFDFIWNTNGQELFYDLHAEPDNDQSGYFKSFEKSTKDLSSGSITALFTGTHGWYWRNSSAEAVTLSLSLAGDYQLITKVDNSKSNENDIELKDTKTTHDTIF